MFANRALLHATQAGGPMFWLSENFYDHITFNIWPPNFQDSNPHDFYVRGAVKLNACKTTNNIKRWTEGKVNRNIGQFKQRDRRKGLQERPKTSGGRGWSQLWFLWMNLFDCFLRYFQEILVNISHKVIRLYYFSFLHNLENNLSIAPCIHTYIYIRIHFIYLWIIYVHIYMWLKLLALLYLLKDFQTHKVPEITLL